MPSSRERHACRANKSWCDFPKRHMTLLSLHSPSCIHLSDTSHMLLSPTMMGLNMMDCVTAPRGSSCSPAHVSRLCQAVQYQRRLWAGRWASCHSNLDSVESSSSSSSVIQLIANRRPYKSLVTMCFHQRYQSKLNCDATVVRLWIFTTSCISRLDLAQGSPSL